MPTPTYLRPRPRVLDPGFLHEAGPGPDRGFSGPPFFKGGGDVAPDPGFSVDEFAAVDGPAGGASAQNPVVPIELFTKPQKASRPAQPSLLSRLSTALEGARGTLDPNAESGVESFFGSAVNAFAGGRQMSRQQEAQAERIQSQKLVDEERRARTRYYDAQAQRQPTGMTQQDRLDIEDRKHAHLLERLRTAADLRRRQVATTNTGKVSQADRIVLGRTERADQAANRGVESHRGAVERGYADALTPAGEDSLRARLRRGSDPNYVADSTAVADRINPQLGVPRPATPAAAPAPGGLNLPGGVRSLLENYLKTHGAPRGAVGAGGQSVPASRPGQSVPAAAAVDTGGVDEEGAPADTFDANSVDEGMDEGDDAVTGEEITAALEMVADLDEDDARAELTAAGYSDAQIDKILKARPTP